MSGVRLAGSVWGCFAREEYGSSTVRLSEAVRSVLDLRLDLGVEVWATRGHGDLPPSPHELEALVDVCSNAPFASVHARGEYWEWNPRGLREEIAFAASIGARVLVIHPGSLGLTEPGARIDRPEIRRLGALAMKRGILFALENTQDSVWALDRLLDELGDDPETTGFGICIDVGHAHISTDLGRHPIRAYLDRYRGPLRHVHLHDTHAEEDRHLVLGKGTIDWPGVFDTLEAVGYGGAAVFEVHDPNDTWSNALCSSVRVARSFLGAS